jgi:hypothetical protein
MQKPGRDARAQALSVGTMGSFLSNQGTATTTGCYDLAKDSPAKEDSLTAGEQRTVTFDTPFDTVSRVTLTPSIEAVGNTRYYVLQPETDFQILLTNTPTEHTIFKSNYQIIE